MFQLSLQPLMKAVSSKRKEKSKPTYRHKCTQRALQEIMLKEKVLDHTIHLYTTYRDVHMYVFTVYPSHAQQWGMEKNKIKYNHSLHVFISERLRK